MRRLLAVAVLSTLAGTSHAQDPAPVPEDSWNGWRVHREAEPAANTFSGTREYARVVGPKGFESRFFVGYGGCVQEGCGPTASRFDLGPGPGGRVVLAYSAWTVDSPDGGGFENARVVDARTGRRLPYRGPQRVDETDPSVWGDRLAQAEWKYVLSGRPRLRLRPLAGDRPARTLPLPDPEVRRDDTTWPIDIELRGRTVALVWQVQRGERDPRNSVWVTSPGGPLRRYAHGTRDITGLRLGARHVSYVRSGTRETRELR